MIARSELEAAHARAAELLTLWQWRKALAYRLRLAQLKFQTDGLEPAEQKQLAADIAAFGTAVATLGERSAMSVAA